MNNEAHELANDFKCEQHVLGVIISNAKYYSEAQDAINADCFYNNYNRAMYLAISDIIERGDIPDIVSLTSEMKKKDGYFDISKILEITERNYYWATFDQDCARLKELYIRRKFWTIGQKLIMSAYTEGNNIQSIQSQTLDELKSLQASETSNIRSVDDVLATISDLANLNASGERKTGSITGFRQIDEAGGFQQTDLIIVAAESSQGKTSFAIGAANEQANHGMPIAFYSIEMTAEQIVSRMLAPTSHIPSNVILNRPMTESQFANYDAAMHKVEGLPIYFDENSTMSTDGIIASIRTMVIKHGIKGAYVDYLQLLRDNERGKTEEQIIASSARRFKNLAKELNIFIVLLSQLSRDKDGNHVPTTNRLRSSGQIEEAADTVILLYRPEVFGKHYPDELSGYSTNGTAMVEVAKGRNIGRFRFIAGFQQQFTHFYNLDVPPVMSQSIETKQNDMPF